MLSIEKAKREDARTAWEIRSAAIHDQCAGYYSQEILAIWTSGEMPESFIDTVEKYFYVAINNNLVIGTGAINIETGKIDAVFVHPDRMRKGIGKMIIDFLEDIALRHGLGSINLESTLNAAEFYRVCGFEGSEISTYISPMGVSLDCIPMVKYMAAQLQLTAK
jgi:GNAT superfamily N-acetyltransferase